MKSAHDVFRGLRARARTGILVEGAAHIAAAVVAFILLSYGMDRGLHLETVFRAAVLAAFGIVLLRVVRRRLRVPLAVELDDDELALAVERTDPDLRQTLISAVEFERDIDASRIRGQSETMMQSVLSDARRRLSQINFVRALDARRVVRFGALLVVAVIGGGAFLAAAPDSGLWARRNLLLSSEAWPRATFLAFQDVDVDAGLRIAEREDLTLRVAARGVVPDDVVLTSRFAGGEIATRAMDRTGEDTFSATLSSLLEDVELFARGGDGETRTLQVRIVPRPRITAVDVTLFPPAYAGDEPRVLLEIGGELRVPRGSELEIVARSNKALRAASLVLGDGTDRLPATLSADATALEVRFAPEQSGAARIEVTDFDDLGPVLPPQLLLRVVEDAAPQVDFETRGVGSLITANARLPGVLRLSDDFGLGTLSAKFRTMDATRSEDSETPAPEFGDARVDWGDSLQVGAVEQELALTFDLLPMLVDPDPDSERNPVRPGQLLSLRFDASDQKAPEAQSGSSEVRTFRVVTREKLLQELRRRQGEQRRELERVLARVREARDEVAEILSPAAESPDAARAGLRLQMLAGRQNALGKTVQGVAQRYASVLDELLNNRLFEPNVVRGFDARVVSPLIALSVESFPTSATLTAAFADSGSDDTRSSSVESYDYIITTIERVLEQMERSETLSEIVETLRIVIRTEREAQELVEKLRDEEGAGIFGDPRRREPPPDDDKNK